MTPLPRAHQRSCVTGKEDFGKRNVRIVVVTFEHGFLARSYVEETSLSWPLLVDATRETVPGLRDALRFLLGHLGSENLWAYLKEILKGQRLKKSEGDLSQRG